MLLLFVVHRMFEFKLVLQGDPTVHIAAPKRLSMYDVMVMALTGGQVCNLTLSE